MTPPAFGLENVSAPISPSKWLCMWMAFAALSAVILCLAYLPLWAAMGVCLVAVGAAVRVARRDAMLMSPQSIILLRFGPAGLAYQLRNGTWREGEILGASVVSRWLSVVAVRSVDAPRRRHIILMPDSLKGDAARRVRVWLRWSRQRESEKPGQPS